MSKAPKRRLKAANERVRIVTKTPKERKTRCIQSERSNSDINNIVAKAYKTGHLPVLMNRQPMEALPDVQTYQEALDKVVHAQQSFEQLPSEIRNKFENDPKKLLKALEKPEENIELLLEASVLEEVKQTIDPVVQELRNLNSSLGKQSGAAANGGEATE
jgi:phage internal scaffolding protein